MRWEKKCKIIKTRADLFTWHTWFAWFPVIVGTTEGNKNIKVWLEPVERMMYRDGWIYRIEGE